MTVFIDTMRFLLIGKNRSIFIGNLRLFWDPFLPDNGKRIVVVYKGGSKKAFQVLYVPSLHHNRIPAMAAYGKRVFDWSAFPMYVPSLSW